MRCQEARAVRAISLLKTLGIKSAETATLEEATKLWSRVERGSASRGPALPLALIQQRSRQSRRAKQTHPGKR